ncbi:MAG: protoheme IX farnesyltransferase [Rhodospirillaceae bacterium]|jgi:heme o synthase|nr:protoheme IX farnesyltransferase [Rhodospirillaceae bacterium]
METTAQHSETETETPVDGTSEPQHRFRIQDYGVLLKPRVMSLVVFTAACGLILAPGAIALETALIAVICIAAGAGASGAINMWYDQDIDKVMTRTMNRPIPAGRLHPKEALVFGTLLSIGSVGIMTHWVNAAAAVLLAVTILYYVFIYTMWLKRRTPQNIVIGGASGAFPPMIGWAAVTGDIGLGSIALFAIIFFWTPPHSWALALFRRGDYAAADVPMMPVVAGEQSTKRQMLVYTLLLIPATLAPVVLGVSGAFYGVAAAGLGIEFWRRLWNVWKSDDVMAARPFFLFSILYLFLIFAALLVDRLVFVPLV